MTFQQIVGTLMTSAFDGYLVDMRLGQATYYLKEGEILELKTHPSSVEVAAEFDLGLIKAAIREARALVTGYTYL